MSKVRLNINGKNIEAEEGMILKLPSDGALQISLLNSGKREDPSDTPGEFSLSMSR